MFFFNDTATTEIYTLSLHDALPIFLHLDTGDGARHELDAAHITDRIASAGAFAHGELAPGLGEVPFELALVLDESRKTLRSEEHTSELPSRQYLVCRLLLEKKHQDVTCDLPLLGAEQDPLTLSAD